MNDAQRFMTFLSRLLFRQKPIAAIHGPAGTTNLATSLQQSINPPFCEQNMRATGAFFGGPALNKKHPAWVRIHLRYPEAGRIPIRCNFAVYFSLRAMSSS